MNGVKKIIIDADACPAAALEICRLTGGRYAVPVWTVASFNHNIASDHHVTVGDSPQETDIKVSNLAVRGDIAVTQDLGLAAMLAAKGVKSLSPSGFIYSDQDLGFMLEERAIKAKFRRSGGRTKGPRKRTPEDDRRFAAALEKLLAPESETRKI